MELSEIQNQLGGKIRGDRIEDAKCPECGQERAYVYANKEGVHWLGCNRRNECGFTSAVFKLPGFENGRPPRRSIKDQNLEIATAYWLKRGIRRFQYPNIELKSHKLDSGKWCLNLKATMDTGGVNMKAADLDPGNKYKRGVTFNARIDGETIPETAKYGCIIPYQDLDLTKTLVVVEGLPDLLTLLQVLPKDKFCIIAKPTGGAKKDPWTPTKLKFLDTYRSELEKNKTEVILALDSDEASLPATRKLHKAFSSRKCNVKLAYLGDRPNTDWNDLLREGILDRKAWDDAVQAGEDNKGQILQIRVARAAKEVFQYLDYVDFFHEVIPDARYCPYSKAAFYMEKGEWCFLTESDYVKELKSIAEDRGLPIGSLENHLHRWLKHDLKENLLIEIPKWDGNDHIKKMISFMKPKKVSIDIVEDAIKSWCAGIFRRMADYRQYNQAFVLASESQGLGKDYWIDKFLEGFGLYMATIMPKHDSNSAYQDAHGKLITYIDEIDASSFWPSEWKSFISAKTKTYRSPYAKSPTTKSLFYSVLGSTNHPERLLNDESGFRRWWIIEVDQFDMGFVRNSPDPMQIVAQAKALHADGYYHSDRTHETLMGWNEENKMPSTTDLILESFLNSSAFNSASNQLWLAASSDQFMNWIQEISRAHSLRPKGISVALGKAGLRKKLSTVHYVNPKVFRDNPEKYREHLSDKNYATLTGFLPQGGRKGVPQKPSSHGNVFNISNDNTIIY